VSPHPSSIKEDSRASLGRNALIVLLVAPIVGVLWWFGPSGDDVLPMGRTEERFRSDAAMIFSSVSSLDATKACQYSWKQLKLLCTVPPVVSAQVHNMILSAGWERVGSDDSSALHYVRYQRSQDIASFQCGGEGASSECTLTFFALK
jgi:hypothetical protein